MIKVKDTDVVVIAISVFPSLKELGLEKMWIAFGQGKHSRWIPVHVVVNTIGPEKTRGLPFFHAFTGYDVVSAFRGRGKKCAWQTWNVCKEVSNTFAKLSQCVPALDDTDLQNLEKFVVIMYDRSSASTSVNDARLNLFVQKQRPYDAIPPTQSAVRLHAKRAIFQGGIIWVRQLSPGLTPIVQWNGDGSEKTTLRRYAGSTFHQLLQVVKNLLNVIARRLFPEMQVHSLWTELYSFV